MLRPYGGFATVPGGYTEGMAEPTDSQLISDYLVDLYGADPFAHVRVASNAHRVEHAASLGRGGEQTCGVYPSDAPKMRVLATLVRATGAQRILEIGCGLGYSALWLAEAAGPRASIETIDRFPEHIAPAERHAEDIGYARRIAFHQGEAQEILLRLSGPYDLIHDDGWFAEEPSYFQRMVDLLRPGGLMVMSNWFLLAHAITGKPDTDWSQFAGPDWATNVKAYARRLTSHPQLHVSLIMQPAWVALACKLYQ